MSAIFRSEFIAMQATSLSSTTHSTQEVTVMQCENVWDLLSAYADGETDAHETTVVEAHIAACADCARDLQFMQGTQVALHSLPDVEPPISLRSAILAATINRPTLTERFATAVRRGLAPTPVRYGALAAAGAAAALTAVTLRDQTSPVDYVRPRPTVVATAPTAPEAATPDSGGPSVDLLEVYEPAPAPSRAPRAPRIRTASARAETAASRVAAPRTARHAPRSAPAVADTRKSVPTEGDDLIQPSGDADGAAVMSPDPEPTSRTVAAMPEQPTDANGPAATVAAGARSARIVLTASSVSLDPAQVATLADLRRSLGQQANSTSSDRPTARRDRQIRLDVIRGSF
jgi:hypothetical protein